MGSIHCRDVVVLLSVCVCVFSILPTTRSHGGVLLWFKAEICEDVNAPERYLWRECEHVICVMTGSSPRLCCEILKAETLCCFQELWWGANDSGAEWSIAEVSTPKIMLRPDNDVEISPEAASLGCERARRLSSGHPRDPN